MEIWNEGPEQQQTLIGLAFGWLEDALEAPIKPITWRRSLFLLGLLPVDKEEYGDPKLGIKLSKGNDGKQYAAIADGKRVIFADGSEVATSEQLDRTRSDDERTWTDDCTRGKHIKIGDDEIAYEVRVQEAGYTTRSVMALLLPRRRRCGRRCFT